MPGRENQTGDSSQKGPGLRPAVADTAPVKGKSEGTDIGPAGNTTSGQSQSSSRGPQGQ